MDLIALRNEITNDPTSLGYVGKTDQAVADTLNAPSAGILVTLSTILPSDLWECINVTEWKGLSITEQNRIQALMSMQSIAVSGNTLKHLKASFPTGSVTLVSINNLITRSGSRAEQLFGAGSTVSPTAVKTAMGRG